MKRKIILSLLALFLFSAAGAITATFYIRNTTETLARLIKLHQVEDFRQDLIISIQTVQIRALYRRHRSGPRCERDDRQRAAPRRGRQRLQRLPHSSFSRRDHPHRPHPDRHPAIRRSGQQLPDRIRQQVADRRLEAGCGRDREPAAFAHRENVRRGSRKARSDHHHGDVEDRTGRGSSCTAPCWPPSWSASSLPST